MAEHPPAGREPRRVTHRDLIPFDLCPSLMMKQILTHGLDDPVWDDRQHPGDGYYWCLRTCREIGPDDAVASPEACRSGRACHRGMQS